MHLAYRKNQGIGIIRILGELDMHSVQQFEKEFPDYLKQTKYLVLDLAELEFIDSIGIGAIAHALQSALKIGGDIKIARMHSKTKMLFEITNLHKFFDIYDNLDKPLDKLKQKLKKK
jgi:anti-anti-sigma factor